MLEIVKVYGPYLDKKAGRKIVRIRYSDGSIKTTSNARFLMEQHLGRELDKSEEVDHKDDDRVNDDISNLQLMSKSANIRKAIKPA